VIHLNKILFENFVSSTIGYEKKRKPSRESLKPEKITLLDYELMLRDDSSTYERLRDKFVLPEHHRLTRQELHDFVKHQAIRGDPRLMQHNHNDNHNHNHNDNHNDNGNDDYVFDNFSIIITYGRVGQQVPHIDLISPNFQFGLALSDGVPGTLIYQNTAEYKDNASVIRAVHDMWKANPDISDTLYQALVQNLNERNLLSDFARLLLPFELIKKSRKNKISTGTLLSTPGSVIHAGPGCTSFRAIIFCSAWPSSRRHSHSHSHSHSHTGTARAPVAPYNPDVQATKSILWCKLICCVWETVPLCDRKYLLTELVKMIQKKEHPDLELLILEPKMIRFIVEIKNTRLKRKQFELVSKYAKMDNFCLIGNAVVVVSSSSSSSGSDDEGSSQKTKRQRRCD